MKSERFLSLHAAKWTSTVKAHKGSKDIIKVIHVIPIV